MDTDNSAIKAWVGDGSGGEGFNGEGEGDIYKTFHNTYTYFLKIKFLNE